MLICPQCHFENPDTNRYCQSCGTSLTHKTCARCGNNILLSAEKCDRCGGDTAMVLWALITEKQPVESVMATSKSGLSLTEAKGILIDDLSESLANRPKDSLNIIKLEQEYLDEKQRYRLDFNSIEELARYREANSINLLIKVKVFDCQPLQKSYFKILQEKQAELFIDLEQDLELTNCLDQEDWQELGIPLQALPYLKLQKFSPAVPEIYDAWQQEERDIILLPDRSRWQLVTQVWTQQNLPLLPILLSLDEMARLWTPLCQIGCGQSLLIEANLRVDEDLSFCLEQLYTDIVETQPSLPDLAKNWQRWLIASGKEEYELLIQVLNHVIDGVIDSIEQLRQQLQEIASQESLSEASISIQSDTIVYLNSPIETEELNDRHYFFEEDEDEELDDSDSEEQPTLMIPMQLASIIDAGCTDIGVQRDHNEDFFWIESKINKQENGLEKQINARGLYIVCDGMGGHAAGEIASAMAVEKLQQYFQAHWLNELPDRETITNGILDANETLYQNNIDYKRSGSGRMGTTLVMALVQNTQVAIAHVGDSRIYRITRQQGLEQLTLDHEVGQREINRGVEPEIAYGRPDAYQLTQALGPRENKYIRPDIQYFEIQEDCLLLLCSDGLCDHHFLENHWETNLAPLISSSANIEEGLFQLIDLANKYNGHDNITAILVRIKLRPTL
jgi:protein phosphatase